MIIDKGIIYEKTYMNQLQVMGFVAGFKTNHLVIPERVKGIRVTEIAGSAFANQTCLETVSMPKNLEYICERAFSRCLNLREISLTQVLDFEEKVTLCIKEKAFENCFALKSFLGNGRIVTLEVKAFEGCSSLQDFDLQIQKIKALAFYGCWELKKLTFAPSGILQRKCFTNITVEQIQFNGDGIIDKNVFDFIRINNVKIRCIAGSNIESLAYEGYHIEIFDKMT